MNQNFSHIENVPADDVVDGQGLAPTLWPQDIAEMHGKFGVNEAVRNLDKEKLAKFLKFRIDFLQEELNEMVYAKSADDVVDALIDLCVVAIGTLNAFDVNAYIAWNRVHDKNMQKQVGIKASRPNPLGLPDLIKPEGWTSPTHVDNVGMLAKLF
jgi:predicted HAD superfamily Cof-like phosphohydrolase